MLRNVSFFLRGVAGSVLRQSDHDEHIRGCGPRVSPDKAPNRPFRQARSGRESHQEKTKFLYLRLHDASKTGLPWRMTLNSRSSIDRSRPKVEPQNMFAYRDPVTVLQRNFSNAFAVQIRPVSRAEIRQDVIVSMRLSLSTLATLACRHDAL